MTVEPTDGAQGGIDLVLALEEAVPFIGVVADVDRLAEPPQRRDHLLGLELRHADVVVALQHEQRRLVAVEIGQRTHALVDLTVLDRVADQPFLIGAQRG